MLNFALCDDNESILARLSKMLESLFIKYNFDCKVTFTSVDPNSFLAYVINNPVDVIFLDIDLKNVILRDVLDYTSDITIIIETLSNKNINVIDGVNLADEDDCLDIPIFDLIHHILQANNL